MTVPKVFAILMICFYRNYCDDDSGWHLEGYGVITFYPCNDSSDISVSYHPGLSPDEENKYSFIIMKDFPKGTEINLKFNSDAIAILHDKTYARLMVKDNTFTIKYFESHYGLTLTVQGVTSGVIPYASGISINHKAYCKHPVVGYLDEFVLGYQYQATDIKNKSTKPCGKPKVTHTELIVNGLTTKPGAWPWHVALYRLEGSSIKFICGGTLISNTFVLTAAHCATVRGVPVIPEILSVVLAKYNLIGGDIASQEKEVGFDKKDSEMCLKNTIPIGYEKILVWDQVHQIIIHEQFKHKTLDHDIALLKLRTEVKFDDYIQPACLWNTNLINQLATKEVFGTVDGWGFDQTDSLSAKLRKATLPILPESTCLRRNPVFYSKILNENKFCAGLQNGTSPCNGDSGGGFLVFVPDEANSDSKAEGAWYARGIVSVTVARSDAPICDPTQYVVFTDISQYLAWIKDHAEIDIN